MKGSNLWVTTEFDYVLNSIVGGGTPSKSIPSYYQGAIPWMSVKDMNKAVLTDTVDHITQEAVDNSSTNIIPQGTPIIATRMSLGKIVVADFDSAINQDLKALFHSSFVPRSYLIHWYKSQSQLVESLGTGTTVKGIRLEVLKALKFPLAPLAEQKEIANQLDSLLAKVDSIKNRLDTIPDIIKRFRQSVLASAVSGKLTEEWRRGNSNLVNVDVDFDNKHSIDDKYLFDVPKQWLLSAIGNVCSFQQGLQISKSSRGNENDKGVLPILRTVNYENDFSKDVHYAFVNEKSIIADPEDIILSRTGTVGRVLTGFKGVMHNNSFRINYSDSKLLREYLIYFLNSPICQVYVQENSGRSTQPDLTHKAFSKCPIPIPSVSEQDEIITQVKKFFSFAESIEKKIVTAQERVDNLTQSILAKAFRGELTAEWRELNQALITGENSAEALLAKIKAEREALSKKKTPKKKMNKKTTARKAQS